jgi:transposase, IS5 family
MTNNTVLHTPKPDKNITPAKREKHKRKAAIETVIGHLKYNYRMIGNYLKGTVGHAMNVMLAAGAMNFKRMMNKGEAAFVFWTLKIIRFFIFYTNLIFAPKVKMTF